MLTVFVISIHDDLFLWLCACGEAAHLEGQRTYVRKRLLVHDHEVENNQGDVCVLYDLQGYVPITQVLPQSFIS